MPTPSFTFSHSQAPPSNQRKDPLPETRSSISHGIQTDPITIRAEVLIHPILQGLVSLAAMQVLALYDSLISFCSDSLALMAVLRLYIAYCLRPMLRGVHLFLIWLGVFIRILSAIVAILTPDLM